MKSRESFFEFKRKPEDIKEQQLLDGNELKKRFKIAGDVNFSPDCERIGVVGKDKKGHYRVIINR